MSEMNPQEEMEIMEIIEMIEDYVACWRDANTQTPPYEDYEFLRVARESLDEALALSDSRLDDDVVKTARLLRRQENIVMPLKMRVAFGSSEDGLRATRELKSFQQKEAATRQRLFRLLGFYEQMVRPQASSPWVHERDSIAIAMRSHRPIKTPRRPVPTEFHGGGDEELWAL
jgi:hypothetical protein